MTPNEKIRVNPLPWPDVESGIITAFKRSVHLIGNSFRFEMANRQLSAEITVLNGMRTGMRMGGRAWEFVAS
ncbi:hypothetical protein Cflav_PD1589 [Pedosphaera parvula Ellin514]|uniref:Uncharacterized protein n=1 Tax=Pedosphaera parvula (strain Ellin514) TaxID=320771 RepID=B9XND5_PEDPL|nr:hypothetical protein Cflav_PD1589 [Pedosphaera parvula Ellin514]